MAVDPTSLRQEGPPEPIFLAMLREHGIESVLVSDETELDAINADEVPDMVLIDAGAMSQSQFSECAHRCSQLHLPALAMIPHDQISYIEHVLEINDFVLSPSSSDELVARARRVIYRGSSPDDDSLRIGDLVINTANYEVSLKNRKIYLRLKEYELLLLMASTPGRVFTREALLKRIWGYDYLGGTRTVDVHIRRLRSKIEDGNHQYIETVWQVGYRFRDVGLPS